MSDIRFNGGYNNCDDRMNILKNSVVQRRLDNFEEIKASDSTPGTALYVDHDGVDCKIKLDDLINPNRVKSDFAEENPESDAYILNKESVKDFVSSRLTEPLTSLYTVGGVSAGEVFDEGTPILDIIKAILSVSRGTAIRFGIFNEIPTDVDSIPEFERSVSDLLINGFSANNITLNNQYYILAVPRSAGIIVDSVVQGDFPLSFKYRKLGEAWDLYYDDQPATGVYSLKYNFVEGSHND